ncbi:tat pathway signal sequence [Diplocarpon rosae]|nr:tat pathway signal sequence [Diplocarpon rosae]
MSWPNPFRRSDANTRHVWGYTFQWTPRHMSAENMHPMKLSYDTLGEECLNRLDEISPPVNNELPRNQSRLPPKATSEPLPRRDLYALLKDHASEDPKLGQLWHEVNTVPDWVDWDQIARGQDVFYRYGGVALTALAYQSLLGGMGAARVSEVLARTGGFSPKVAKSRLYETTQHILQVTSSLHSIQPGGAGHISSIRVRLLHAAVRRRILALAKEKPSYYSVEDYGIPINDLDSIGTISTFSATLIWIGFPRQGIWLREQEVLDYMALWRLVAYYIGTPDEYFATPERARAMMESLLISEIQPSETSRILASNVILALQNQPPAYASRDFLNASARWLNGDELADALGLGRPGWYYKALVAGQCVFFVCLCYTYRSIPYLDRRKIKALRRIFYHVIVNNQVHGLGEESSFEFKYIPNLDTKTLMGEYVPGRVESGVERRNLKALVMATAAMGLVSYLALRIAFGVLGELRSWWSS